MDCHQRTMRWKALIAICAIFFILIGFGPQQIHAAENAALFNLSSYQGKIVWLDFWASWCVPCRRSFPWLNGVLAEHEDEGFVVIGINVDKDEGLVREFLEETPANFPIIYDPDGKLATRFGVVGMPSSFIIGRDGQIIADHVGFKRHLTSEYETTIRNALAQ
jgi:thiol-disulfide isomerase/thioredoxin